IPRRGEPRRWLFHKLRSRAVPRFKTGFFFPRQRSSTGLPRSIIRLAALPEFYVICAPFSTIAAGHAILLSDGSLVNTLPTAGLRKDRVITPERVYQGAVATYGH
ncbi:hypothetical protein B0H16DRAFT_1687511, partial [Mycena metata]